MAVGVAAAVAGIIALVVILAGGGGRKAPPPLPGLKVQGTRLLDGAGRPLRVLGVNRSGTEYYCVQNRGIFDGPSDDASIATMASWGINAVRIPLNEDCWLGLNGVNPRFSGLRYQQAIVAYVNRLMLHKLDVIFDLQWVAPGTRLATRLESAPDADHAARFWSSVARQFRGYPGVAYDLFNEPHQISWSCWRDGCVGPDGWRTAGMQQLIDAVRAAGARQPVIAEGLGYAADLSGWLAHRPVDRAGQLVAGWHMYNQSLCSQTSCWDRTVAPLTQHFPVLATEVGETDCRSVFLGRLLPWADARNIGYLAWTWNPTGCSIGPALIRDYAGTPTPYGAGFLAHINPAAARSAMQITQSEFANGTDGWTVRWGSGLTLTSEPQPAPAPPGLTLKLSGRALPAAGTDQRLAAVGAGSTVRYQMWAPPGVDLELEPMITAFNWNVTLLPARRLHSGSNTITFRVPDTVPDVRVLGFQLNNRDGWNGGLVIDHMDWSPAS